MSRPLSSAQLPAVAPRLPVRVPGEEIPTRAAAAPARSAASSFERAPALRRGSAPLPAGRPGPVALTSPGGREAVGRAQEVLGRGVGAGSTFTPRSVERDELGMTHVRMDRTFQGLPVFGEQVIVHFDRQGRVDGLTGNPAPLTLAPGARDGEGIDPGQALRTARAAFGAEHPGLTPDGGSPERLFHRTPEGTLREAYRVELTSFGGPLPLRMSYFVDAGSGEVVRKFNQLGGFSRPGGAGVAPAARAAEPAARAAEPAARAAEPAVGKGRSLYSGQVRLGTAKNADGTWSLKDLKRGGSQTWDARNQDPASGKKGFKDGNNAWGERADSPRARAAVDAHYGMEMTWDFYKGVLGRESIDGKGEALNSYVHVGSKYVNAYWDGEKMNYGDGDGKDASPLVSLDVAGHEITHGLTERTAGLIYDGESGGLNEAMSDILGTGVEWHASKRNKQVKWDYRIGEDVWTPGQAGDALRYMDDPKKDGYSIDHYRDYPKQTEVHGSSGIANNAFYLLSHGGKNRTSGMEVKTGIGMEKSLKIFGRALVHYMTPSTTFAEARKACVKAATDLYGADSVEAQKVRQAWTAVGVK